MALRDSLLSIFTDIHELLLDDPLTIELVGEPVLIREMNVAQRLAANAAAVAENPDEPDQALYRAMLIQSCIVDPATGSPYSDGRVNDDGTPMIDPRTRATVFRADDLPMLTQMRDVLSTHITNRILELGALTPRHLKSGDPRADG